MVQGIVNTFNKSRNPHQHMQSNLQNAPLHSAGFINQGSNTNNSLYSQERIGQNLLSSTVVVQDKNPNGDSEEDDSDDPDMDGVFENDKGEGITKLIWYIGEQNIWREQSKKKVF